MPFLLLLWRLLTLKSKAEDMPYSFFLLIFILLANIAITTFSMHSPEISEILGLKAAIVSALASGASLWGMLRFKKLHLRFVQLWSAILAVDTICTGVAFCSSHVLGINSFSFLMGLLLSGWAWWVSVQFLVQAFGIKPWGAMIISVLMQFASVMALFVFLPELAEILNKANS